MRFLNSVLTAMFKLEMTKKKPPVFVLGCPRSGTTLLYHMLLSAGGFAVYRTESHVFDMIVPRFGDLSAPDSRARLMKLWLNSHYFRLSGLEAESIYSRIMTRCRNGGDFLRIVMESIAEKQNVDRWAETTPTHLLYISEIKRMLPDALVIHIIRDGRDVALSMDRQGWIYPFPWDRKLSLMVAGLYWEWIVSKGRKYGRTIAPHYLEVHFEDLLNNPQQELVRIGNFIDHDLDYDRIQKTGIGSVSKPNTSFKSGLQDTSFNPVGRWKSGFSKEEARMFEGLVGPFLKEMGYNLSTEDEIYRKSFQLKRLRYLYLLHFSLKQWLKAHTPLSRVLVNIDFLRQ